MATYSRVLEPNLIDLAIVGFATSVSELDHRVLLGDRRMQELGVAHQFVAAKDESALRVQSKRLIGVLSIFEHIETPSIDWDTRIRWLRVL